MIQSRGHLFVSAFARLFLIYCLGLGMFLISRVCFTFIYGDLSNLSNNLGQVASAFVVGFRTDTMSLAYGLLPAFLLILGIYITPSSNLMSYDRIIRNVLLVYSTVVLTIFLLILIADFYFYRFFNDHLNILVFALMEDDTQAVLTSMWTDYPVLRIILLISATVICFVFIIRRILKLTIRKIDFTPLRNAGVIILSLVLVFTAMRNSWGMFPFRMQNTIVSNNTFINKIGVGGVYSLQNAFKERSEETINTDIKATLKKYKFSSVNDVLKAYLNKQQEPDVSLASIFTETTPANKFLAEHRPNVVVVQMESMSNHLLDFHSKDFNVLGELEHQLPECYMFRNFVSASPTTIHSLEALIIASPETPISQSVYRGHSLSSSAALPYKRAGYNTCFFTGAELAWRNLEGYLSKAYFNDIEGNIDLHNANPLATMGEWGTYDEFLFDRIFQKLDSTSDKPQFIYAMTTSNHTPYDLPETYKGYSLTLPKTVENNLKADRDVAMKNFLTYQYANDCLGKFIKRIRESRLGENTIVVAVGDHSIGQLFNTPDELLLKKISIPLILYVPAAYRPNYEINQQRFGSHKDVFPTVYNLSLSEATYVKSGNNLCASPVDSTYFFGVYKYQIGFSKAGCVLTKDNLYFNWSDTTYDTLRAAAKSTQTDFLNLKTRAYSAAMSCYIKDELSKADLIKARSAKAN